MITFYGRVDVSQDRKDRDTQAKGSCSTLMSGLALSFLGDHPTQARLEFTQVIFIGLVTSQIVGCPPRDTQICAGKDKKLAKFVAKLLALPHTSAPISDRFIILLRRTKSERYIRIERASSSLDRKELYQIDAFQKTHIDLRLGTW